MCRSPVRSSTCTISWNSYGKQSFHRRCQSVSDSCQGSQPIRRLWAQCHRTYRPHFGIIGRPHNGQVPARPGYGSERTPFTSAMCRPINQYAEVITALTERAADLRTASTVSEAIAEERLVPDSLAPVEGTAPSYRRTGTPVKGSVNGPAKCPPFDPVFPPIEPDRPDHGLTARTADRAVLIDFRRFLACAVERRAFLAGANPARQLSFQPVVARAVCGGNDVS